MILTTQAFAEEEEEAYDGWILENCDAQATFERKAMEAAFKGISLTEYIKGIEKIYQGEVVAWYKWNNDMKIESGILWALQGQFVIDTVVEKNLVDCYEKVMEDKQP